jgi:hypothetical protein
VTVTGIFVSATNTLPQALWGLSADDTLQEVGSSTGIRYFNDYEEYLTFLETGLRQRNLRKSIINIIKGSDGSLGS